MARHDKIDELQAGLTTSDFRDVPEGQMICPDHTSLRAALSPANAAWCWRICGPSLWKPTLREVFTAFPQFAAVRGEIAEQGTALRAEISAVGTQMRVLHEEVISRIALVQEGSGRRARKK